MNGLLINTEFDWQHVYRDPLRQSNTARVQLIGKSIRAQTILRLQVFWPHQLPLYVYFHNVLRATGCLVYMSLRICLARYLFINFANLNMAVLPLLHLDFTKEKYFSYPNPPLFYFFQLNKQLHATLTAVWCLSRLIHLNKFLIPSPNLQQMISNYQFQNRLAIVTELEAFESL